MSRWPLCSRRETHDASGAAFVRFLRRRLVEPILELLRQGVTPEKIALSLAFGLGLGIFPVLGVSTMLCTLVAICCG